MFGGIKKTRDATFFLALSPVLEDVHVAPAVDALALVADGAAADRDRLPLAVLEPPTVPRSRQFAGAWKEGGGKTCDTI